MKDLNDKKIVSEQENVEKIFIAEMDILRKVPEFQTYLNEIKELGKAIVYKIMAIKPLEEKDTQTILYYQAQLDLLLSIFNISREVITQEITDEQFD